jgi:YVTN family beta-propeller protein
MSFRRLSQVAAVMVCTVICLSCGQVYRPVVIPVNTTPPNPSNFHTLFAISANGLFNPGSGMQIDVSGDTKVGAASLGVNPTHAALLPSFSRVFVSIAGSVVPGGSDSIIAFAPAADTTIPTGLGTLTTYGLPFGSQPVFVQTTTNTAVYAANFGTNSVAVINASLNVVSNIVPVGVNPVALAETPDGNKLYSVNQGDSSVTSLNTVDMSQNIVTGFSGVTPVWAVARGDSQKVYVLAQGSGQLITIDTTTDTVSSSLSVGGGANFLLYDQKLNRLYVTNPSSSSLFIFSATGGAGDTPVQLAQIAIPGLSASSTIPCPDCSAPAPSSVAALPDGSRLYVASYQTSNACPDPNLNPNAGAVSCVIPQLTVIDAGSFAVKTSSLFLLAPPLFAPVTVGLVQPFAVAPVTTCVPAATYGPATTRFRIFTTASEDSSHVFVSMCDAGAVASVITSTDTMVVDLASPFSAAPPGLNGEPPPQNPLFLLTGQ